MTSDVIIIIKAPRTDSFAHARQYSHTNRGLYTM